MFWSPQTVFLSLHRSEWLSFDEVLPNYIDPEVNSSNLDYSPVLDIPFGMSSFWAKSIFSLLGVVSTKLFRLNLIYE